MGNFMCRKFWMIACCGFIGYALGQVAGVFWIGDFVPFIISICLAVGGGWIGVRLDGQGEEVRDRWFMIVRNVAIGIVVLFGLWLLFLVYIGLSMAGPF